VLFLGDSVTAGYGVTRKYAFPSLIQDYWDRNDISLKTVNAGLTGYTTEQILIYLDTYLTDNVCYVFLQIGGNDAYRGVPIETIKKNLQEIIDRVQAKGLKIGLAYTYIPPEQAPDHPEYVKEFNFIWREAAYKNDIPLAHIYRNVFDDKRNMGIDGHPSKHGHKVIARNILEFLNSNWKMK
jgi:acyl-CoA thioesterase I